MLSQPLQNAINKQIGLEFASAHAYLAMSAFFEARNLPGFAHWYRVQAEEEVVHAMKFFDYLNNRGARVQLEGVAAPLTDFSSPLDAAQQALGHEQKVTAAINQIYEIARAEGDPATQSFLKWFVDEQVEEEKTADELIEQIKLVGDGGLGLFMIDRQLAARPGAGLGLPSPGAPAA